MAIDWRLERQKLARVLQRSEQALHIMRTEAKRSGTLVAEAQWHAQQRDEFAQARALPLAAQAYAARINAEAARFEAGYFLLAHDLREEGLTRAEAASSMQDAQRRQPFMSEAETITLAADTMEQAALAAGQAARDKAPPLPPELVQTQEPSGGEMSVSPSQGWRPKNINQNVNNFWPADIKAAAGGLQGLGDASADDWWAKIKKAFGAGVAAAGNEAAKQGQATSKEDPAAGAALNAGGGTLQWLSTLLNADYQAAEKKPAPSAPFPWLPVLIGTGVVGVTVLGVSLLLKKKG